MEHDSSPDPAPAPASSWARCRAFLRRRWRWAALPPLLVLVYVLALIPFTPAISDIRKANVERPAQLRSADGQTLAEFKRANREWVALDQIAPEVVQALIATEDHRFYQHHGIDWRRTASSALHTLSGDRQGGSTLTQQLARNLYPDEIGRAPTLTRKIKEAITALKIEALYSKNEILETYLNTVPFLYNAYGIEMAARTYFDKSARRLTLLESATLIGMLKGNAYYNPVLHPERSVARRNTVMSQMVKHGHLDEKRFQRLKRQPLRLNFERQIPQAGAAPHLAQRLKTWLIDWADQNDYNIYADGLVVYTTIDSRVQGWANRAVERRGRLLQSLADQAWSPQGGWRESAALVNTFVRESSTYQRALDQAREEAKANGKAVDKAALLTRLRADRDFMNQLRSDKIRVQVGLLAVDPRNGQVRAWVGSRDHETDPFDHVQQARRQPGSTFKPFVYGAAFLEGAQAEDTLPDHSVDIPLANGGVWRPADNPPPSDQPMSLRNGLAHSRNGITAQLVERVGAGQVARLAHSMGVRQSTLDPVPSLGLGTSPVTLQEMVTAYATMANGGQYIEPMLVTRIETHDGKVLATFDPPSAERALPVQTAYMLIDVLRDAIDHGTGRAIRRKHGIQADVAGKTGTTQDNADGWFILMHPELVTGAWVGFNDSRVTLRSDYWGQGAHSALPMVGDVVRSALRAGAIDRKARFEPPAAVDPPQDWLDRLRAWWGER